MADKDINSLKKELFNLKIMKKVVNLLIHLSLRR